MTSIKFNKEFLINDVCLHFHRKGGFVFVEYRIVLLLHLYFHFYYYSTDRALIKMTQ